MRVGSGEDCGGPGRELGFGSVESVRTLLREAGCESGTSEQIIRAAPQPESWCRSSMPPKTLGSSWLSVGLCYCCWAFSLPVPLSRGLEPVTPEVV